MKIVLKNENYIFQICIQCEMNDWIMYISMYIVSFAYQPVIYGGEIWDKSSSLVAHARLPANPIIIAMSEYVTSLNQKHNEHINNNA